MSTSQRNDEIINHFLTEKIWAGLKYPSESALKTCQKPESVIRAAARLNKSALRVLLLYLLRAILNAFKGRALFTELHNHILEPPLDGHNVQLPSVADDYHMHLFHAGRQATKSLQPVQVQPMFTKLNLFRGQ